MLTVFDLEYTASWEVSSSEILNANSYMFNLFALADMFLSILKKKTDSKKSTNGAEWYIIVVSTLSGIFFGILLSCIILCFCRRKFKMKEREPNLPMQRTDVDRIVTYAEPNISGANTESNYLPQYEVPVDGNALSYTELTRIRNVENSYQTLIK